VSPRRRPRPAARFPGGRRRGDDAGHIPDRVMTSHARPPPSVPAAPREREAQRARRARASARGSGSHAGKRRPRPTAAPSRSARNVSLPATQSLENFDRGGAVRGTRHRARRRGAAFCASSATGARAVPPRSSTPRRDVHVHADEPPPRGRVPPREGTRRADPPETVSAPPPVGTCAPSKRGSFVPRGASDAAREGRRAQL
jgi:hypothetical protein